MCFLPLTSNEIPVPVVLSEEGRYQIIYPNSDGFLELNSGIYFHLLCSSSKLVIYGMTKEFNKIQVMCYENDMVLYNGLLYEFKQFLCEEIPKSDIIVTEDSCNTPTDKIVYVGFKMGDVFLPQYGVCFDTIKMISHYTWYEGRTPYNNPKVEDNPIPEIIRSQSLYNNMDVGSQYEPEIQVSNRKNILISFKYKEEVFSFFYSYCSGRERTIIGRAPCHQCFTCGISI